MTYDEYIHFVQRGRAAQAAVDQGLNDERDVPLPLDDDDDDDDDPDLDDEEDADSEIGDGLQGGSECD